MTVVATVDIPDLLSIYASSQPGKLAVIDDRPGAGVVSWTYAQLEAEANRLANVLASLGAGPGEKVIWCGPNSPQVVAVTSATRKLGAVAVPLSYRLTPAEARYIVIHSDARIVYADAEYAHLIPAPRASGSATCVMCLSTAAPRRPGCSARTWSPRHRPGRRRWRPRAGSRP
jgi:acyl-CoA synthetase (AMP-forming)/AMP-acid ligase II